MKHINLEHKLTITIHNLYYIISVHNNYIIIDQTRSLWVLFIFATYYDVIRFVSTF